MFAIWLTFPLTKCEARKVWCRLATPFRQHSKPGAAARHCRRLALYVEASVALLQAPRTGNHAFARLYNESLPETWHVINVGPSGAAPLGLFAAHAQALSASICVGAPCLPVRPHTTPACRLAVHFSWPSQPKHGFPWCRMMTWSRAGASSSSSTSARGTGCKCHAGSTGYPHHFAALQQPPALSPHETVSPCLHPFLPPTSLSSLGAL
jgi:hypothetical protein